VDQRSRDRQQRDRQLIADRVRHLRFGGALDPADATATAHNPSCGDQVRVTVLFGADHQQLAQVRCQTRGCVLCTVSADWMAEVVSGQTPSRALELGRGFVAMLQGEIEPDQAEVALTLMRPLAGLLARSRCALLPWQALSQALAQR